MAASWTARDPAAVGTSHSNRRILLISLVLGLLAALLLWRLLSATQAKTIQVNTVPVVVAKQDIPARTTITAGMLDVKQVPNGVRLSSAFTDTKAAVGQVTRVQVNAGERIGITGPNGAGKSTLLRLLLGHQQPDGGVATLGSSVAVGEIDQARGQLDEALPLGAAFEALVPELSQAEVRTLLAKFGLKADQVRAVVGSLSPGERTRAALALLQAREVNLLVLDEPTNHLDLPAIEQLEQALDSFGGTVLLVTHDRRMLADVQATRRWHVEASRLQEL